jgi:hypothetical protein
MYTPPQVMSFNVSRLAARITGCGGDHLIHALLRTSSTWYTIFLLSPEFLRYLRVTCHGVHESSQIVHLCLYDMPLLPTKTSSKSI